MGADVAFIENGIDLKYFGKFMERVNSVIVSRDNEIFSQNKVNLLLGARAVGVLKGGEVEDEVNAVIVGIYFRAQGRRKELLGNEGVNRVLFHEVSYFFSGRTLKVNPGKRIVRVSSQ